MVATKELAAKLLVMIHSTYSDAHKIDSKTK